jgi:hypothetical protein
MNQKAASILPEDDGLYYKMMIHAKYLNFGLYFKSKNIQDVIYIN